MSRARRGSALLAVIAVVLTGGAGALASGPPAAGPDGTGHALTPNGWFVTPAGRQVQLGDRPYGMALTPDGSSVLVSNDGQSTQSLMRVEAASGQLTATVPYDAPQALFLGVAVSPDGRRAYASAGGNDRVRVYDLAGGGLVESAPIPLAAGAPAATHPYPAGLALSADGRLLLAAENLGNALAVVDLGTRAVTSVGVGRDPYTVVLSGDGRTAYVSNWGEQTVSAVDVAARRVRTTIRVGTHPSAMARNPRRPEVYVADTDSDTISVVDTTSDRVVRTVDVAPYRNAPQGSQPDALAVSPDGETLYVANAGNDDVDVVGLAPGGTDTIRGMIPTGWYPTGIEVSPDGRTLYVANAKGLGAGPNRHGPDPYGPDPPPQQYVGSMITGTLSIVATPDATRLAGYTRQVVADNGFDERDKVRAPQAGRGGVIPRRVGDRSPIRHVIYVVKENRTYDQVLGSLGKGNGDPSLDLFDDRSAPNVRELARRFVTLDNFYANAEVSADGWSWSTEGNANTYDQKSWPANYSTPGRGRPYDFEGGTYATAAGRDPTDSYLWDRLDRGGVDFRNYGVWVSGTVPAVSMGTSPALDTHTDPAYPGFNLEITDQARITEWEREFRQDEATGRLPTFEFVRLPNDHTSGTRPGARTPRAMVADNDLAVGRLVDAVSHSAFWSSTAIFVVEDDAQNGPDHVDAHRTVALAISPYTQTGRVDSTFYSTVSMLRTMELILGLQPLTQFDAAATPMLGSFSDRPRTAPYTTLRPRQPLDELNAATAPMALASSRMDLTVEDRADMTVLDEAVWKSVRGEGSAMPAARHRLGDRGAPAPGDP